MRFLLILGFVVLTSLGGYLYGKKALRLSNHELSAAWRTALECMWLSLVFFTLNLLVAFTAILTLRAAAGRFFSLYDVSDITLLPISLIQGIIFHLWHRTALLRRFSNLPLE